MSTAMLETVETANWHTKVTRKDYAVALNATGSGVDDPDQQFYENYACGSARNYSGYCNPEIDKQFDQQSMMTDQEKRKKLVWEIDKQAAGRRRPADHLPQHRRHLHAAAGQGADDDGQQHLQRLALGGRVARQIAGAMRGKCPAAARVRDMLKRKGRQCMEKSETTRSDRHSCEDRDRARE